MKVDLSLIIAAIIVLGALKPEIVIWPDDYGYAWFPIHIASQWWFAPIMSGRAFRKRSIRYVSIR